MRSLRGATTVDGDRYCTAQLKTNVVVLPPAVAGSVPRVTPAARSATVSAPAGQALGDAVLLQVTVFAAAHTIPAAGVSVMTAAVTGSGPLLVTCSV